MAGSDSQHDEEIITAINVTPLVDIMLVLLIIFMLTANLIAQSSITVELPQASTGEGVEPTTVAITITESEVIYLNGKSIDEQPLFDTVFELAKQDSKLQAIIAADKSVTHGTVVRIIDLIRKAGIVKFAINIDPEQKDQ